MRPASPISEGREGRREEVRSEGSGSQEARADADLERLDGDVALLVAGLLGDGSSLGLVERRVLRHVAFDIRRSRRPNVSVVTIKGGGRGGGGGRHGGLSGKGQQG